MSISDILIYVVSHVLPSMCSSFEAEDLNIGHYLHIFYPYLFVHVMIIYTISLTNFMPLLMTLAWTTGHKNSGKQNLLDLFSELVHM